jgi:hypothetical protein
VNVGPGFPPVVTGNAVIPSRVSVDLTNSSSVSGDLILDGVLNIGNNVILSVYGTCYISGTLNVAPVSYLRCLGLLVLNFPSILIAQTNVTGGVVPVAFRSLQGVYDLKCCFFF